MVTETFEDPLIKNEEKGKKYFTWWEEKDI